MAEKTLGDIIAKKNKSLSFEERSKKFTEQIKPVCEDLGILPWSKIIYTNEGVFSSPSFKDLWESGSA